MHSGARVYAEARIHAREVERNQGAKWQITKVAFLLPGFRDSTKLSILFRQFQAELGKPALYQGTPGQLVRMHSCQIHSSKRRIPPFRN